MNINSLIGHALHEAEKSTCHHKHGAIIFRKGKILSRGFNKTNRKLPRFQKSYWPGSLHAEIAAILDAQCSIDGAHCLIVRRNMRHSYPCPECYQILKSEGIKSVFWSDGHFVQQTKVI